MSFRYRVEIYKRDTERGIDLSWTIKYVKTSKKLTRAIDVISMGKYTYGVYVDAEEGAKEYVDISEDQIAEWFKLWQEEEACNEAIRYIEKEIEVLYEQKRKAVEDRVKNSKKRFKTLQKHLG